MANNFTQNDNFDRVERNRCHFVYLFRLQQHLFSSQLEVCKSRVEWDSSENQHRLRGP